MSDPFAGLPRDPMDLFQVWLTLAEKSEPNDPNAAALASATGTGVPSVRMVLIKGADLVLHQWEKSEGSRATREPSRCSMLPLEVPSPTSRIRRRSDTVGEAKRRRTSKAVVKRIKLQRQSLLRARYLFQDSNLMQTSARMLQLWAKQMFRCLWVGSVISWRRTSSSSG